MRIATPENYTISYYNILFQFFILFFLNRFTPLICCPFAGYFHGKVRKPRIRSGAMPMLYSDRDIDHITGLHLYGIFPPFLIVTPAADTE